MEYAKMENEKIMLFNTVSRDIYSALRSEVFRCEKRKFSYELMAKLLAQFDLSEVNIDCPGNAA